MSEFGSDWLQRTLGERGERGMMGPVTARGFGQVAWFLALTFAITWSIAVAVLGFPDWFERTFGPLSSGAPAFYLAVWAPNIVAVALTLRYSGGPGLTDLLRAALRWRVGVAWWGLAAGFYPAILFVAGLADVAAGRPAPDLDAWTVVPAALVGVAVITLGPIGEELGWRGYLLPRLQPRWGPTGAALAVGLIWMIWHFPAFKVATLSQSQASYGAFLVSGVAISVFMTWIYNRTRGSVLVAGIIPHLVANATTGVARFTWTEALVAALAALAVIAVTKGRLGYYPDRDTA
jgi:membrane protease YdiL (CAAX protease family)